MFYFEHMIYHLSSLLNLWFFATYAVTRWLFVDHIRPRSSILCHRVLHSTAFLHHFLAFSGVMNGMAGSPGPGNPYGMQVMICIAL